MIEHLSYSSISLYLECPEAWRRRYIVKEPSKSSPALVFGSAFHAAIEAQLAGGRPAAEGWEAAWEAAVARDDVYWGADTPEQHFNEGLRLLGSKTIAEAIGGLTVRSDDQGPMIERRITLSVPGVSVPVIGYIDMIAADGTPCDLKTSARAWDMTKAEGSLQGLVYLAALNQAGQHWHGWRFRHIVFVKTQTPKVQVLETLHRPAELFFLFRVIRRVWEAIQCESFPPNPTSWRCSGQWCDFWANCRGRHS